MGFTVHLKGFAEFERDMKRLDQQTKQELGHAYTDVVGINHDESVKDTPLDEGPLRETSEGVVSGRVVSQGSAEGAVQVASAARIGETVTAKIGYVEEYAVKQHETLHYNHPKAGKAKFLEDVVVMNENQNVERLKQGFKQAT